MKSKTTKLLVMAIGCLTTLQVSAINLNGSSRGNSLKPATPAANGSFKDLNTQMTSSQNKLMLNASSIGKNQFLKETYEKSKAGEFKNRPSLGGFDAGGGKTLLCPSKTVAGEIEPIILDTFEGKRAGYHIDLGPGQTIDEKIKYVLDRLSKVSPYRAKVYAKWMQELLTSDKEDVEDSILPVTNDIGETTVIPKSCEVLQVAFQRNDRLVKAGLKRYVFDKDILKYLSIDSIVELYFHEIVYREARLRGDTDSILARHLNYIILSKEIEKMSVEDFNEKLKNLGSKCVEMEGLANRYSCGEIYEIIYTMGTIEWDNFKLNGLISKNNWFDNQDKISFMSLNTRMDLTPFIKDNFSSDFPFSVEVLGKAKQPTYVRLKKLKFEEKSFSAISIENVKVVITSPKEVLTGVCYVDFNDIDGVNWIYMNINNRKPDKQFLFRCEKFQLKNNINNITRIYESENAVNCKVWLNPNGDLSFKGCNNND